MQRYRATQNDGKMLVSTFSSTGTCYLFGAEEVRGLSLSTFIDRALSVYERIESGLIPCEPLDVICGMVVTKYNHYYEN